MYIEIFLVIFGLLVFSFIAWRRLDLGLSLVLFFAPLYLLKIIIAGLPLTVLELMILAVFIIWVIKKAEGNFSLDSFKKMGAVKFWLPLLLILAGVFFSALLSPDIKISAGIFKSWFLEPIIFGLILIDTIKTKRQAGNLLLALLFSGTAVAIISFGYLPGEQMAFGGRLRAFFLSPNHLAMYLAPAFLIGVGFLLQSENKRWRQAAAWCLLPLGISCYLTFSYAAGLGVLAAIGIMLFFVGRWQGDKTKMALLSCLFILIILMGVLGYLQWNSPKLNDFLHSNRSSWQSRLMIWRSSFEILKGHWLWGIGPGMFQKYYLEYQKYFLVPYLEWAVPQPHNVFLAFWLQAGIMGLVGFILLIINFFHSTFKFFWNKKRPLALVLLAVMIYILVHGLLDTIYWKNDLALIFWTITALGYITDRLRD